MGEGSSGHERVFMFASPRSVGLKGIVQSIPLRLSIMQLLIVLPTCFRLATTMKRPPSRI
jgi:hypothetical protein